MAEDAENDPSVAESATDYTRCRIQSGDTLCGRSLHTAPKGIDEPPVCLMHSNDPGKQQQDGTTYDLFWRDFENILTEAGDGEAVFSRFIFPSLDFAHRQITANCDFSSATFTQNALFSETTFTQNASFFSAIFTKEADFYDAIFTQEANFYGATFAQEPEFCGATFTQEAEFSSATFTQDASFRCAIFTQQVDFSHATFMQDADFSYATFKQDALFVETVFKGIAFWRGGQLLGGVKFRRTHFTPLTAGTHDPQKPSLIFADALLSQPAAVIFDHVDLSQASFYKCDISQIRFEPDVRWGKQKARNGILIEEALLHERVPGRFPEDRIGLYLGFEWTYREVAQIYQQLKKNYDARLDYWTANEFHFGEMEMQRMDAPIEGPLLSLRRWWHRNLSLVAWYKYASDYGNSFTKPLYWLGGILLLFAFLFPLPGLGLQQTGKPYTETYTAAWRAADGPAQHIWWEVALFLKGLLTAIDTAVFQKSPMYTMANPLGHAFTVAEMLLTSTLFALFLLAIRRQFRR